MASYRARAVAIHEVVVRLRRQMERYVDGAPADKAVLIGAAVEATNKLLYCFALSPSLLERIDRLLNDHLDVPGDPQSIALLYGRALDMVRRVERVAAEWVVRYD